MPDTGRPVNRTRTLLNEINWAEVGRRAFPRTCAARAGFNLTEGMKTGERANRGDENRGEGGRSEAGPARGRPIQGKSRRSQRLRRPKCRIESVGRSVRGRSRRA